MMNNWWLRLGCFLTGYKYHLIKHSSVASEKAVIKYSSAILVACLIWGFIGFSFAHRYLKVGLITSIVCALILSFIVIQIERQIILTVGKNHRVLWFRGILAVIMAFIGSIIIDQIIFNQDIEGKKISNVVLEVNKILPQKTQELNMQIEKLDTAIEIKGRERANYVVDVSKNPTLSTFKASTTYKPDSNGTKKMDSQNFERGFITNPKTELIPRIDAQIATLNEQKMERENRKLTIEADLYKEINSKNGFLDELQILFTILFSSKIALFIWFLLWLFFFSLELLVLLSKIADNYNDYEQTILHQMNIRIDQLKALKKDRA